jgi:WD40 repeat protein
MTRPPEQGAARQDDRVLGPEHGFCAIVEQFLSASECDELIARAERSGFREASADYPPSYRDNCRLALDDDELAARLLARLRPHAPATLHERPAAGEQSRWQLASLNARLRFCRYRAGQQFRIHQDGVYFAPDAQQSRLTFMVYLSDGSQFSGGDTLFYASGPSQLETPAVIARIRPRQGMLILFDHAIWHAGEPVRDGEKYILRSDLIYRRLSQVEAEEPVSRLPFTGHRGYVWAFAALPDRRVASAGRDASIRLWDHCGARTGVLRGHSQSVLGLAVEGPEAVRADGAEGDPRLASVSRDRTLKLWDLTDERCLHSVIAHDAAALAVLFVRPSAAPVSVVAPHAGVPTLVTGAADKSVKLWDHELCELATLRGHTGWVWALAQLGETLIASASEDGTVRLWELARAVCRSVLPGRVPLRTLACSADGRVLVTGDLAGYLSVWSDLTVQPRIVLRFAAHSAAVRRVRFMDRHTLLSAGEDRRVRCWSLADGLLLAQHTHDNFVTDVLPIGDDRYLSCSYDSTILAHQRLGLSPIAEASRSRAHVPGSVAPAARSERVRIR